MDSIRYVLGTICLLAGTLIVVASYVRQIRNYRNRNKNGHRWSSPAPFIGPALIIAGYFVLPVTFCYWLLLVFALDPDTMVTVLSIPLVFKESRQ